MLQQGFHQGVLQGGLLQLLNTGQELLQENMIRRGINLSLGACWCQSSVACIILTMLEPGPRLKKSMKSWSTARPLRVSSCRRTSRARACTTGRSSASCGLWLWSLRDLCLPLPLPFGGWWSALCLFCLPLHHHHHHRQHHRHHHHHHRHRHRHRHQHRHQHQHQHQHHHHHHHHVCLQYFVINASDAYGIFCQLR